MSDKLNSINLFVSNKSIENKYRFNQSYDKFINVNQPNGNHKKENRVKKSSNDDSVLKKATLKQKIIDIDKND